MSRRPPSQRDPDVVELRALPAVRRLVPGALMARTAQPLPRPLPNRQVPPSGGLVTIGFYRDRFPTSGILSSAAGSYTLTWVPAAGSLHLYLNGLEQDEGTDYAVSAATITILTSMGLAAGDVLDARYAYGGDLTAAVPFGSTGWSYKYGSVGLESGFEAPSYSLTGWSTGQGAFGQDNSGQPLPSPIVTSWPATASTDLCVRRALGGGISAATVSYYADDNATVYWNGTVIYDDTTSIDDGTTLRGPITVPTGLLGGTNVIAVRARDRHPVNSYLDVEVSVS